MSNTKIEYVIYCRKSTDESGEGQKQSIPDQIKACMEYAKRENLTVKKKPKKGIPKFETKAQLKKEDKEKDLINRKIYINTRKFFIIKEEETAKIYGKRKKWNELIKLIKKGDINGIISYSPDRQARNMLDGGEIIDLVDKNNSQNNIKKGITVLDLKYTNFHFEDNAAGKMMLGIWFVFSKQYSDKLGEDIRRGNSSAIASGKARGAYKHGFIIDKNGYHKPHPKNFNLIKEAFEKKLKGETDVQISDYINGKGYLRKYKVKNGEQRESEKMTPNKIYLLWKDPFYYGIFNSGNDSVDLRETNPHFKAIITEAQHTYLFNKYRKNSKKIKQTKINDTQTCIRQFSNDFIISEDGYNFIYNLPNVSRFDKKINKELLSGNKVNYSDIVKPHQILYSCKQPKSKLNKINIKVSDIDKVIVKALKKFKVGDEEYKEYLKYAKEKLKEISHNSRTNITTLNQIIAKIKQKKDAYISKHLGIIKDKEEKEIYQKERNQFSKDINALRKEIEEIEGKERNKLLELEVFVDLINNTETYYKNANFVQRGKIAELLFLNIKIDSKKRVKLQVKPIFKTLTNPNWWS